ncbi:adenylate/guanylate cyclase domain-containing protein, partial [archaeon]
LLERLTYFTPRPVLTAIYSGTIHHIGELRQVTTMFISLDSYDHNIHTDPITLQEYVQSIQEVLGEVGGYMRQFLVDDKGCVCICMWGTPSYTYANNCSRALYAAVMLQHRVQALGHVISIGITTGVVYCGCVGTPQRRDFVGIGSDVNMAARYMGKAQGRIFIDECTMIHLDEDTKKLLVQGDALHLKGAPHPVTPFIYISSDMPSIALLDSESSKNLVLKRNVMALIAKRLDIVCNYTPPTKGSKYLYTSLYNTNAQATSATHTAYFTLLLAPLGNGNFAAEYFRHCARKRNINCYSVCANPTTKHTPYSLIRQIFLELIGMEHFTTESQQRFIIDFLVNQAYPKAKETEKEHAKLSLQLLLGVQWLAEEEVEKYGVGILTASADNNKDVRSDGVHGDAPGDGVNDSVLRTSRQLIRPANDQTFYKILSYLLNHSPTALIIENAHWCDELSWNELHLVLVGKDLNISILMTMKASNSHGSSVNSSGGMSAVMGGGNLYEKLLKRGGSVYGMKDGGGSSSAGGDSPVLSNNHRDSTSGILSFAIRNHSQRQGTKVNGDVSANTPPKPTPLTSPAIPTFPLLPPPPNQLAFTPTIPSSQDTVGIAVGSDGASDGAIGLRSSIAGNHFPPMSPPTSPPLRRPSSSLPPTRPPALPSIPFRPPTAILTHDGISP